MTIIKNRLSRLWDHHIDRCRRALSAQSRITMLVALCFATGMIFDAQADRPGDISEVKGMGQINSCGRTGDGCPDPAFGYDAAGRKGYNVGQYTRPGAHVKNLEWNYTAPSEYPGGSPQGTWRFSAQSTCQGGGSWGFRNMGGDSLCWDGFTLHSVQNCKGERRTRRFSAKAAGHVVTARSFCRHAACAMSTHGAQSDGNFIYGRTSDHMMALKPSSEGFFEYPSCGRGPYWIERPGGGDQPMMIPSKCNDFDTFAGNSPAIVSAACYPATIALCGSPPTRPSMPPHPSCGSSGHRSSWCERSSFCINVDGDRVDYCSRRCTCDCGRTSCSNESAPC